MPADPSTCPDCGSPIPYRSNHCPNCGLRLDVAVTRTDPTFAYAPVYPENLPHKIRNPHQQSLISLTAMAGLLVLPVLAMLGVVFSGYTDIWLIIPTIILTGLLILFAIAWVASWVSGQWQLGRIRAFLTSNRPLLRWTYSPEEWQEIRDAAWQEQQGDWRVQFGCMTVIFGLIGLLIGGMIGLDEGLEEAILYGLAGGFGGLSLGGVLGGAVAAGNYLAARSAYRRTEPALVALAPHEIYANDQYFRGDGYSTYVKQASMLPAEPGIPHRLVLELKVPPKPRSPRDETWEVMVPSRLVKEVEDVIPRLNES